MQKLDMKTVAQGMKSNFKDFRKDSGFASSIYNPFVIYMQQPAGCLIQSDNNTLSDGLSKTVKFIAYCRPTCYKQLFDRLGEQIMEVAQLKSGIAELKARVEAVRDWL